MYPDYGPDCLPCTGDDVTQGIAEMTVLTTASAEAAIFDANGSGVIDYDESCFGAPCLTQRQGTPFDCGHLTPVSSGGMSTSALAACFPIDAPQIGDNVTCATFGHQ